MTIDAIERGASSYPGGKSGSGVFQRLINLIPPHRVLIVPFAGKCGVTRRIRPAEHTIVIDKDPEICEWWSKWQRTARGRELEIHNCDGIDWMRFHFGCTEYSDARSTVAGSSVAGSRTTRQVMEHLSYYCDGSDVFVFCDPPYVLSERKRGRIYDCEMTDEDHIRLLGTMTSKQASRYQIMICGYSSNLYEPLDPWTTVHHRVPTRGGLQDEKIWINYEKPVFLHDYSFIGDGRRNRERIRRRQRNWKDQLMQMTEQERTAMLLCLNSQACDAGSNVARASQ